MNQTKKEPKKIPIVDRRIGKTKKSIKHALFLLMEQKDISAISVTELADLADINRKTFYLHYQSVEDVILEIEDELITSLKDIIEEYRFDSDQSKILGVFLRLNQLINEDYEFFNNLIRLDDNGSPTRKIKEILKDSVLPTLVETVEIDRTLLQFLVEFVATGITSLYVEWFYTDKRISLEKLAEIASAFSYNCILTMEKIKLD